MSWQEDDRDESPTVLRYHPGQRLFNRYVLEYSLARGGMGVVWLAHDEVLDRRIALKFLPDRVRTDAASLDHLKREAQKSIQLAHHHIVKIHDFVPDAESPAISMEFVDGDTLADLRKAQTHKVFEVDDLRPKLRQLCAALEYAHETVEIVHRDLKPSNLLINRRGQLKVADFGIASSLLPVPGKTQMERGGGTPGYMSPQQAARQPPSVLDDIYSLGATIYDLLTSRPPFYSEEKKQVVAQMQGDVPMPMEERRQRLRIRGEAIPRRWDEAVAACLAYDPAQRPQTVRELAELLGLSDAITRPSLHAPDQPAGLRAKATDQRVVLTWQESPTAAAYNLKRSPAPGGPHTLIATVGATTSYADTGLRNDIIYYYVIEAVNAVGVSPASEEVHAQPKAPPLPVTGLAATVGDRLVSLTWQPAAGVQGYMVQRSTSPGGPYVTIATVTSGMSFQDAGLENGVFYCYIVQAVSEVGPGPPSLEVRAIPCPPPLAPAGLTLEVGDRVIRLAWKPVSSAVAYHVLRARQPGGPYVPVATLEEATHYEDEGLENGLPYYYVVESLNASGCSPHSGETHAIPQPIPQRPAGLRVEPGDREALLSWAGASFATSYQVSRARTREGPYEAVATVNAGTSFLDAPLENHTTYYYRVQAVNAAGVSEASREIGARPRQPWNVMEAGARLGREVLLPWLRTAAKVGGVALGLALVAWLASWLVLNFLWIRQGIRVETAPPGAAVLVDGEPAGASPLKKKLSVGKHEVEIRQEGFEPERREVQIQSNKLARLSVPLNRSAGTIQISTIPEGRYAYQIKDREGVVKTGITPETVKLPSGRYSVEVTRPDWPPHVESVTLAKEQKVVRADFSPAVVRVTSDPPGAEILLRGKLLKATPAELALPPQRADLVARYPGLRDQQQSVTPERGRTNTAHFVFDYGGVVLQSDPPGAQVRLAGTVQEVGKTPYTNLVVAEGRAEYLLQLSGYNDRPLTVQIVRGKTAPVKVTLEKYVMPLGQLLVLTRPSEAVIYLNGTAAGQSGVAIPNLTPGRYRVRAELEGYEPEDLGDATVTATIGATLGPVKLKPSQGVIQIVSNPAGLMFELLDQRDAVVSKGVTGTALSLTTGVYTVQVKRPDWPDFIKKLTLERNRTNLVKADFPSGQVEVVTDPPGAEIRVRHQRRATSPATLELPLGETTLEARYPGLTEKYESLTVDQGETRKVVIEFDYGTVVVTTEPPEAIVIDALTRKPVGRTPWTNAIVTIGKVAYQLRLTGFKDVLAEGTVERNQTNVIRTYLVAAKTEPPTTPPTATTWWQKKQREVVMLFATILLVIWLANREPANNVLSTLRDSIIKLLFRSSLKRNGRKPDNEANHYSDKSYGNPQPRTTAPFGEHVYTTHPESKTQSDLKENEEPAKPSVPETAMDEMTFPSRLPLPSGIITLLVTDIIDGTKLNASPSLGDTEGERNTAYIQRFQKPYWERVCNVVKQKNGIIVKSAGDGLLCVFTAPTPALLAALEVQSSFRDEPILTPFDSLQLHVGIHTGEGVPFNNDYNNQTANRTYRIASHCPRGDVYLSKDTYSMLFEKVLDCHLETVGFRHLKGLGDEEVYRALFDVLPAPKEIKSEILDGKIRIQWELVSAAVTYNVFRQAPGNLKLTLLASSLEDLSFVDDKVRKGRRYTYYVESVGHYGRKARSNGLVVSLISNDGATIDVTGWDLLYEMMRLTVKNPTNERLYSYMDALNPQDLTFVVDAGSKKTQANPLFAHLPVHAIRELLSHARLVECRCGEELCTYGTKGDTMFVILKGEVGVHFPGKKPGELLLVAENPAVTMGPGNIVGELAAYLETNRTATVRSITDTALLLFYSKDIQDPSKIITDRADRALIEKLFKTRAVEHLCRKLDCFIGEKRNGPLSMCHAPWERLSTHTSIVRVNCDKVSGKLRRKDCAPLRKPALYFLAGGYLQSSNGQDISCDGFPLIFHNWPGYLIDDSDPEYLMESNDVTLVCIEVKGIVQHFGRRLAKEIAEAIHSQFQRNSV